MVAEKRSFCCRAADAGGIAAGMQSQETPAESTGFPHATREPVSFRLSSGVQTIARDSEDMLLLVNHGNGKTAFHRYAGDESARENCFCYDGGCPNEPRVIVRSGLWILSCKGCFFRKSIGRMVFSLQLTHLDWKSGYS